MESKGKQREKKQNLWGQLIRCKESQHRALFLFIARLKSARERECGGKLSAAISKQRSWQKLIFMPLYISARSLVHASSFSVHFIVVRLERNSRKILR
jgi:hypothetical protein